VLILGGVVNYKLSLVEPTGREAVDTDQAPPTRQAFPLESDNLVIRKQICAL
jgi:hypothetical protein